MLSLLLNAVASHFEYQSLSTRTFLHGPAAGWTYLGCYTDVASSRTLLETSSGANSSALTGITLQAWNTPRNVSALAQSPHNRESRLPVCDFNIQGTAKKVNDTQCNSPCTGDGSYICGGTGYISIYQDKGHNGVLPTNRNKLGNWTFEGCYKDNTNVNKTVKRTLSQRVEISTGVTVEKCTAQCAVKGFHISGLEFGQECCDCSQACKANHTELCGAANRLSIYTSAISA
ncbi:hypothetical protein BJ912DRAFT_920655 [Pholiota molesta]|nr:hypothetical protein BJ912DRAFT_920655 [Pholiota molesta]